MQADGVFYWGIKRRRSKADFAPACQKARNRWVGTDKEHEKCTNAHRIYRFPVNRNSISFSTSEKSS